MIIFSNIIIISKDSQVPVYLQIANSIIAAIKQGILKPGDALPSSRKLAALLKIHRKTAVAAYDELDAQNWVEVLPRKGFFVSQHLPEIKPRQFSSKKSNTAYPEKTFFAIANKNVSHYQFSAEKKQSLVFNDGFPDTRLAPVDLLIREYRRFANYKFTHKYLMYGPPQGSENLRMELAKFLNETRGLNISYENILITKGAQMAMYLVSQLLLKKGDAVIVSEPGYFGANEIFEQSVAKLNFVPVDEHGIDMNAVESICKKKKVQLLYVVPHHHHPTTVTLSSHRRMQLLELAMKYRFAIIEDDYDFDFHYTSGPILPLASADYYGNVIYVGSFCKTIAPAIRVGFMIAPVNLIEQAARLRKLVDRQGEQLLEEAMANLLKNGDISRHLKKANKIYHERRDMLVALLQENLAGKINFKIPDGGFAVWANYNGKVTSKAVAEKAVGLGLSLSSGEEYYYNKKIVCNRVRLGFASLNEKEMKEAVGILAKVVR